MRTRNVLITGAAGGIGGAAARLFFEKGFRILAVYRNAEPDALVREINTQAPGFIDVCRSDVGDFASCETAVKYFADRYGYIDTLVNCAGAAQKKLFVDLTAEDYRRIRSVNLDGVFNMCRAVVPVMLRGEGGAIVNVSSVFGLKGGSCEVPYAAAKAGVIGLTRALADELALSGICVNAVAPGAVDTPMTPYSAAELGLDRLITPAEVAAAVFSLAESGHTGEVVIL
ncbi:MAG: SDR family oxidoreductase [Firmicutes bacterium]|nr:SDR family oxidoreductase [Bacillota bacterium]